MFYLHTNQIPFPQNFATARFYFKGLFDVATVRGWLARFQGQRLLRLTHTHTYIHSFNNKPIYMHVHELTYTYIYYGCRPYTMWQDFEGSIYWDELAEI